MGGLSIRQPDKVQAVSEDIPGLGTCTCNTYRPPPGEPRRLAVLRELRLALLREGGSSFLGLRCLPEDVEPREREVLHTVY